jgi:hypothetical protein
VADRDGRVARQSDVGPVLLEPRAELRRLEPRRALLDQPLECLPGLVGLLADLGAQGGLQLRDRAENLSEFGLAAQVGDAEILERLGRVARLDCAARLGGQLVEATERRPRIHVAWVTHRPKNI